MTTDILLSIQKAIATIIKDTQWENHVYLVGGCVRDLILHRSIHDIDIAVDIKDGGIEFVKWLEKHFFTASNTTAVLYQHWGAAKFSLRCFQEYVIDCSQTRNDNYSRNDETVEGTFGTIVEDAQRRDLTINALYINISSGEYVDPTGLGISDIENHIIRNPQDSSLNILRCIRFAVEFGWELSPKIIEDIERNINNLSEIDKKRLLKDVYCIVKLNNKEQAFLLMKKLGVLSYIKPILKQAEIMINCEVLNEPILYYNRRKDLCLRKSILLPKGKEYAEKRKERTNVTYKYMIKTLDLNEKLDEGQKQDIFMCLAKMSDGILLKSVRKIIQKNMLQTIEQIGALKYVTAAIARIECEKNNNFSYKSNYFQNHKYVCVLRSIRLATELGLEFNSEIIDILNKKVPALLQAKKKNINEEVKAILALKNKERAMQLLEQVGAMKLISSNLIEVKRSISANVKKSRRKRKKMNNSALTYNNDKSFDTMNIFQLVKLATHLGWKISKETMAEYKTMGQPVIL